MSKLTKSALLLLAAILFLGFAVSTSAAPPARDRVAVSPPLTGNYLGCNFLNASGGDLDITVRLFNGYSGLFVVGVEYFDVASGTGDGIGSSAAPFAYCKVEWSGAEDDVIVVFCTEYIGDSKACVNVP